MEQINYVPRGFCTITMVVDGASSQSRAKDLMIFPLEDPTSEQTHQLRFYDCSCGCLRQLPGMIVEAGEERIVFAVSAEKQFIIERLARP
ncbi:MAG: hypothetical protein JXO49_09175 [Deltaproteobacteria bacterium]|nr:hypothetical protein [Candidatus Anaeroferrophillus wilburensis]MBN2889501.1 hypothetical protein [Deltaproteobacteria bacterium]